VTEQLLEPESAVQSPRRHATRVQLLTKKTTDRLSDHYFLCWTCGAFGVSVKGWCNVFRFLPKNSGALHSMPFKTRETHRCKKGLSITSSTASGIALVEATLILLMVGATLFAGLMFVSLMFAASCSQSSVGQSVTEISKDSQIIAGLQSPNDTVKRDARRSVETMVLQRNRMSSCMSPNQMVRGWYSDDPGIYYSAMALRPAETAQFLDGSTYTNPSGSMATERSGQVGSFLALAVRAAPASSVLDKIFGGQGNRALGLTIAMPAAADQLQAVPDLCPAGSYGWDSSGAPLSRPPYLDGTRNSAGDVVVSAYNMQVTLSGPGSVCGCWAGGGGHGGDWGARYGCSVFCKQRVKVFSPLNAKLLSFSVFYWSPWWEGLSSADQGRGMACERYVSSGGGGGSDTCHVICE
jgi:hypothetical protein